jgi:hypothetical protein
MSFLDMDERLVDLFKKVELTVSPISDLKEIPEVTVGIIEGGLGNEEELHIAKDLRSKCKILVAWGDCAVLGGINCMRNFMKAEDMLRDAYTDTVTTVNPSGVLPGYRRSGRSSGALAAGDSRGPRGDGRRICPGLPAGPRHHRIRIRGNTGWSRA